MNRQATSKTARLIEGPIGKTLLKLTLPMIFGMFGLIVFNLVDTYFVAQLGTNELAALSFTFPVVLMIMSLSLGLGVGTAAVVSRAIGQGNHHKVQRLTTDSLVLSLIFGIILVITGILTIDPLFRLLGATPEILPLIREYMQIWYIGTVFVIIPMVGNNAIRATGDTVTPSAIMLLAVAMNIILDPLLIFGIGPFPRLELAGAAIATVIARALTLVFAIWVLYFRDKMITLAAPAIRVVFDSWKGILYIGVPTAGTRAITPIAIGIITRLVAVFGAPAVAGFGVASRVEVFGTILIMALASVLGPFVGQNWGAGKMDRVKKGVRYSEKLSMIWGFFLFIVLAIVARPLAEVFSDNPFVINTTVLYLRIAPIGYGLWGVLLLTTTALNVLHKPMYAAALSLMQMFVLYIPLAYLGSTYFGLTGVFVALVIAYAVSGVISHFVLDRFIT